MQPLKTPDAVNRLSADQKEEYRRLKQEIVKRELLRKVDAGKSSASPSPCVSDLETQEETVAKKPSLTEEQKELLKKAEGFESKLLICRKLLQRDKGMLSVLETQKTKKQAVVKAAELKVQKLKEQLQAAMKLLLTSRLELKKVENN
ncbi:zinc finger C3H1 domain-containing protein-like, partial [Saccoglossus kowalevskii]